MAVTLLIGIVIAVRGGAPLEPGEKRYMIWLATIVFDGAFTLGWLAAAAGYGFVLRTALLGERRADRLADHHDAVVQMALGSAGLMLLAWVGGWLGLLGIASAWALLVAGWVLWTVQLKGLFGDGPPAGLRGGRPNEGPGASGSPIGWPWLLAMPAVALMLVAATIAPGVLWQPTEKGAYDVLSYHLQLPKEWLAAGAIVGLTHNVYSYLPNGFEAVFYHLAILRGGAVEAAVSCQLLHAAMAVIAAGAVAALARRVAESIDIAPPIAAVAGAASGAIYLAVPWVIVTATLAYNEQAMAAMGAAALAVALDPVKTRPWRRGLTAGLLVGAAMLAKLTAVGLFALPAAIVLVNLRGRWAAHGMVALLTFTVAAAVPVGLFMLRNFLWTGNPVFPMLTGLFGTAHWTAEQAIRWNAAHAPAMPIGERIQQIVPMLLGHEQYGFVLWPAGLIAAIAGLVRPTTRRITALLVMIVIVQLAFWLGATHLQSRFMTAAILPIAVLIGVGVALIRPLPLRTLAAAGPAVVLILLSYWLYVQQTRGMATRFIGQTIGFQQTMPPWALFNRLPPDQRDAVRLYAEAYATPLYFQTPITYHTVWDASPLGELIESHGVPEAIARLRDRGYTHLLIDRFMLSVWWRPGNYGYDPAITPRRLRQIDRLGLPIFVDDPGRLVIYQLASRSEGSP